MTKDYLAITIGPIYKTIAKASKPEEIWVSSYIFSYLMGLLLKGIVSRKIGKIILPDIILLENWKMYHGAGVFSDRCFVELDKKFDISDFENLRDCVISDFISGKPLSPLFENEDIRQNLPGNLQGGALGSPRISPDALKDYLQIYGLVTAIDIDKESVISKLNNLLDSLECQSGYQSGGNGVIEQIYENIEWFYPSGFGDKIKTTHQYYCVVRINGDNIGHYYNFIGNDWDKVSRFNRCMLAVAKESAKTINDFGGQSVYMAGDDMFFLAPVQTTLRGNNYNIFDLIRLVDFQFKDVFSKNHIQTPTISCGLSILNSKYPMSEAISRSQYLLSQAKNMPLKNSVAVQLSYSCGKTNHAIFNKNKNGSFEDFVELLKDFPDKSFYVSSVIGKIHDNMKLLQAVGKDNPPDFSSFFNNEFETADLDNTAKRLFLDRSSRIFTAIFKEQKSRYTIRETILDDETMVKVGEEAVSQLDSIYRLLNFLTRTDHV